MSDNPPGSELFSAENITKTVVVLLSGAAALLIFACCFVFYALSADKGVLMFWEEDGIAVVLFLLWVALLSRIALIAFRAGVLKKWHDSTEVTWYAWVRAALVIEWASWVFVLTCLGIIVIALGRSLIVYWPVEASTGLAAIILASCTYFFGCGVPPQEVSDIKLEFWYLPIRYAYTTSLRFPPLRIERNAPSVPRLDIRWKSWNRFSAIERGLLLGVWVGPILVLGFVALLAKVIL